VLPEDIFPYPSFRQGQKELADSVYLACKNGQRFVAEAMSGFGKTAAILAGTISAAVDDDLQVLYVCRTKRQVFRVLEELNRFAHKYPVQATSLFSKYDYCLLRDTSFGVSPEAFKWYCSFQTSNNLCSYFLNAAFNQAKMEKLADAQTLGPGPISELLRRGKELHICPYEVTKLALLRSRIVVTTYHYLLDENSRSILIADERPLDKMVAVIDEAHNIRDFVAGNSTTELSFSDLADCAEASRDLYLPRISSAVTEIGERATRLCSLDERWMVDKGSFVRAIAEGHPKDWLSDIVFELTTNSGIAWYSVSKSRNLPLSILKFGRFLSALLASLDVDDVALVKSKTSLFLTDTHPSKRFLGAVKGLRSLVLLSATINPTDLFLRSIGLDQASTVVKSATTDYRFRVRTVIDTSVTTRQRSRSEEMYSMTAQRIAAVCSMTRRGVGVFFPSYALLSSVHDALRRLVEPTRAILVERPGLTNAESEEVMAAFKSGSGCILLAVQGGKFSEGEDFPGEQMDASIVVGLPLSPPSVVTYAAYRRMESDSFDKHQAYLVLSLLPAIRKAAQCAGRHIREPGKIGMVFLMDSRFADPKVVGLMPSWVKADLLTGSFDPQALASITQSFFAREAGR
jgi:DNA excision repair protein ERCC-2